MERKKESRIKMYLLIVCITRHLSCYCQDCNKVAVYFQEASPYRDGAFVRCVPLSEFLKKK